MSFVMPIPVYCTLTFMQLIPGILVMTFMQPLPALQVAGRGFQQVTAQVLSHQQLRTLRLLNVEMDFTAAGGCLDCLNCESLLLPILQTSYLTQPVPLLQPPCRTCFSPAPPSPPWRSPAVPSYLVPPPDWPGHYAATPACTP